MVKTHVRKDANRYLTQIEDSAVISQVQQGGKYDPQQVIPQRPGT